MRRLLIGLALGSTVLVAVTQPGGAAEGVAELGDHDALVALHVDARPVRRPARTDGMPDYSPTAVRERAARLASLQARLRAIDPADWSVEQRIDYLLVRSQLAAVQFELEVVRPWARDPGLAVDQLRRTPYAEVPEDAASEVALRENLARAHQVVARARAWLTEPSAELAGMAIRQLERSDGVNQGEPRRGTPPQGVIGWYDDLIGRLDAAESELVPAARAAKAEVQAYRDWLTAQLPQMNAAASVGLEQYDWYLRNVLLMPYTSAELRVIAKRELARARTFLAIERHRNRGLPEIVPAASADEHTARVLDAEALIRDFINSQQLLTLPEDLPPRFETDAFWIVREGGKRHFWEEITYRDPLNNHIHASIPGHRFDALISRREIRPIRRGYRDGVRAEGWAFYIEEMFLQAGLLDERPRAKELFYIAQLKRAARVPAELAMQTGKMSLQDAIEFLVAQVPLMEPDLARYDLAIYLRRPTYGMNYVMGKVMLEQLLSDRADQLGADFDLGAFHDEFLAAGPIPISLIRWQMTGLDDEVAGLW